MFRIFVFNSIFFKLMHLTHRGKKILLYVIYVLRLEKLEIRTSLEECIVVPLITKRHFGHFFFGAVQNEGPKSFVRKKSAVYLRM
jgi:hypothetical protein